MGEHLLLVDDEPGLRDAIQAYLEESGFTVAAASNALQAWELLEQNRPDLVITDVMMPQVDGYEFLAKLRDDDRFSFLPVVFLTARGMKRDRIQGYDAGCDAYLSKPFDPDELVAIVKNLLRRFQQAAAITEPDISDLAGQIAELRALLVKRGGTPLNPNPIKIDLTPREQSVLDLVVQGLMNKEIASQLQTSVRNIEKYVSRLFIKTNTSSRTELVRFALENGIAN